MEGSQSANHANAHGQTVPETAEANVAVNPADGCASTFARLAVRIELRHHHVGRVRDDSAADTGNVASEERHTSLLQDVVRLLGLAELLVNLRNRALERRELDHRVRDLAGPERVEALVETAIAFLGDDFAPAFAQVVGVGRQGGLHADFDGFEGAQEDVGDEFGGGGGAEVDDCLGGVGEEFLAVVVFEDFVGAVFACALEGVADEGWGLGGWVLVSIEGGVGVGDYSYPAEEDAANALFCHDGAPCLEVGLVELRIDLTAAFDEIERSDGGVSRATGCEGDVSWDSV